MYNIEISPKGAIMYDNIHRTNVISDRLTLFVHVKKVQIALTKFKFFKKNQGFFETLKIMQFQNNW